MSFPKACDHARHKLSVLPLKNRERHLTVCTNCGADFPFITPDQMDMNVELDIEGMPVTAFCNTCWQYRAENGEFPEAGVA
jgi:hypothetical protein